MTEIKKLVEYDNLYYNEGSSPIDDVEYDRLKEELKLKFPDDPYFTEVGSGVKNGDKVKLKYILGSLNKVKIDTIQKWLDEQESDKFIISEKLDGVSFAVNYKNGKVVSASTRGDGYFGKDITEKAKIFCDDIKTKAEVDYRCEAMLVGSKLHESLGFKTRRNGVAGIINRDDTKDVHHITPFFYEILNYDDFSEGVNEFDRVNFIQNNVTSTKNYSPLVFVYDKKQHTTSDIITFYDQVKNNDAYDVDGLVITPINYERENVLYPKNKVAFKINEKPVSAVVDKVMWGVTRTSRVVPLISIEPIKIQGVTISKATGFNAKYINDNKIGVGTIVKIVRSGDVIPYIVGIEKPNIVPDMIDECPACGSELEWEGVDLKCTNEDCWRKSYKEVEHFIRSMGAENITEKTLMKLGIDHIERLYEIDEWGISTIEGFGVKRAQQIVDEIQGTLFSTPEILLRSFGMKNIGKTASREITKHLYRITDDDNKVMEYVFSLPYEELIKIEGIGDITARTFVNEIGKYKDRYKFLKRSGLVFMNENTKGKFDGINFTLTGKGWLGRKEIQTLIEREGGSVKSIGKTIDYLVTNDVESTTGKAKKAREYGVQIILYEDLKEMLGV